MTETKNQVNNHEEEIKKLTSKVIELQDQIIAKDNLIIEKEEKINSAREKGMKYLLEVSTESMEKNSKINELENEIFRLKVAMAKEWGIPFEQAEEKLKSLQKELSFN